MHKQCFEFNQLTHKGLLALNTLLEFIFELPNESRSKSPTRLLARELREQIHFNQSFQGLPEDHLCILTQVCDAEEN